MLDYIKNQIKSRMPVENKSVEPSTEDIENEDSMIKWLYRNSN